MMAKTNHNTQNTVSGVAVQPPLAVNQRRHRSQDETVPPTSRDLTRFTERCRARDLGYELPLNTREAADYVGFHPKTMERMAREGEVPAHPASGVLRKTWKFYPSELDAWLRAKVNSPRHPCSPNGKDTIK
jgi:excisionase family DNA binding protein